MAGIVLTGTATPALLGSVAPKDGMPNDLIRSPMLKASHLKERAEGDKLKRSVYGVANLHVLLAALQRRQRIEQRLLRAIEHAQVHGDRIGEIG